VTVHALAQAVPAVLGNEARLVILLDEIVEVVVGLEDDAAAARVFTVTLNVRK